MRHNRWIAVFKAEYYTTTARFRRIRKWIPILFLAGVLFISFFIRTVIDYLQANAILTRETAPPIGRFFAIISMFSFFTLFGPFVSPLGRTVYDGSAQSRREVAMASPVKPSELLIGNSLANLVFFLPFYALVGTISLTPFVGFSSIPPLVSTMFVFLGITLLIILGLIAGTLITPIVYKMFATRKNDTSRAIVTFLLSLFMISALPLLRLLIEIGDNGQQLGALSYLPFILATTIIVYGLYGIEIGVSVSMAIFLLALSIVLLLLLGAVSAKRLYDWDEVATSTTITVRQSPLKSSFETLTVTIPNQSIRLIYRSLVYGALRDLEHLSRLTMGIAIAIFLLFALSEEGLFRGGQSLGESIEEGILLFTLITSAATLVFIEVANFTVTHKSVFEVIKSAPHGAKKFVMGKMLQMLTFQAPIFLIIMLILTVTGDRSIESMGEIGMLLIFFIFCLICIALAIYLINPSDNEEDLTNFINLMVFYALSFGISILPVTSIILEDRFTLNRGIYLGTIFVFSLLILILGIRSLEEMDIETLNGPTASVVKAVFMSVVFTVSAFILLPNLSTVYFFLTNDLQGQLIVSTSVPMILPAIYFLLRTDKIDKEKTPFKKALAETMVSAILMLNFAFVLISAISQDISTTILPFQDLSPTLLFLLVVTGVLAEELFFIEFLYQYLWVGKKMQLQIFLPAMLFGLLHLLSLVSIINAIFAGLILGILRQRTGSVFYPIIAHLLYNLVLLLVI